MKKILPLFVIGVILIPNLPLLPMEWSGGMVLADGGIIIDHLAKVYLPSQKAAISWDGQNETMILSTKIRVGDLSNMAWLIPIPSKTKPEIEEGEMEIFYDLANLFPEEAVPSTGHWMGKEAPKVEVIESKKIDIYDITTLKATDAQSLVSWLNENGYLVSESAAPILEEYCSQENFYFIANKINLANKYKDLIVSDEDRSCAEMIIDQSKGQWLSEISNEDVLEALEGNKICQNAHYKALRLLIDLGQGIATPIKIKFQPKEPFYPLKISSINDGLTNINVYLFSETPVQDKSKILSVFQMTENWSFLKHDGFDQKYVTFLVYSDDLANLSSDSWFEETKYDSGLDPNYGQVKKEGPGTFSIIMGNIAYYLLPPLIFVLIFGLAIFGFVVIVRRIVAHFRKKKS